MIADGCVLIHLLSFWHSDYSAHKPSFSVSPNPAHRLPTAPALGWRPPSCGAGPEPHLCLFLQGSVRGKYLLLTMAGNWKMGSQLGFTGLSYGTPGSP